MGTDVLTFKSFIVLLCVTVLIFILYFDFGGSQNFYSLKFHPKMISGSKPELPPNRRKRVILVYTSLFGRPEWYHLPSKDATNFAAIAGCKYQNCEVTYDKKRLRESDVVIFHARDMPPAPHLKKLTDKDRPYKQRWVYFISETPINTPDRRPINGLFNWTMTYKKESDIWIPYKKYVPLSPNDTVPKLPDYAAEKNKIPNRRLAFWISSNCGKLRDQFVRKLQDLVWIDVAGYCGRFFRSNIGGCKRGEQGNCISRIGNYKFYLAFENSFCDQYVTEKYWQNALEHDSVPVVMGGGPYNDPKVAIPGSFINVADFPTIKALADYLLYLDKNNTAYNEYFKWKLKYKPHEAMGWPYPDSWTCEICERLHHDDSFRTYDRLSDFWSDGDCHGKDGTVSEIIRRG